MHMERGGGDGLEPVKCDTAVVISSSVAKRINATTPMMKDPGRTPHPTSTNNG